MTTSLEDDAQRAETDLLAGRFAGAFATYSRRIVAVVVPVVPDVAATIDRAYAERRAHDEDPVPALTGASFARWVFADYTGAIALLDALLAIRPDDVYGTLFRGSSRVLHGTDTASGLRDLERAIELDLDSPDIRFVVADACTYGSRTRNGRSPRRRARSTAGSTPRGSTRSSPLRISRSATTGLRASTSRGTSNW